VALARERYGLALGEARVFVEELAGQRPPRTPG